MLRVRMAYAPVTTLLLFGCLTHSACFSSRDAPRKSAWRSHAAIRQDEDIISITPAPTESAEIVPGPVGSELGSDGDANGQNDGPPDGDDETLPSKEVEGDQATEVGEGSEDSDGVGGEPGAGGVQGDSNLDGNNEMLPSTGPEETIPSASADITSSVDGVPDTSPEKDPSLNGPFLTDLGSMPSPGPGPASSMSQGGFDRLSSPEPSSESLGGEEDSSPSPEVDPPAILSDAVGGNETVGIIVSSLVLAAVVLISVLLAFGLNATSGASAADFSPIAGTGGATEATGIASVTEAGPAGGVTTGTAPGMAAGPASV